MHMAPLSMSFATIFLRIFTIYNAIDGRKSKETQAEPEVPSAVAHMIVERRKQILGLVRKRGTHILTSN